MSVRNTILNQLATDMTVISGTAPYETSVASIKRGIHFVDDFDVFPAVSFWCYKDDIEQYEMGGTKLRWLYVYMFGYTTGSNEVTTIHDFADDVEYFLDNGFTYKNNVIVDNIIIYESGTTKSTDDAAMFRLEFRIKYMS